MISGNSKVHILQDSVARKIAAGEVIDRPFSVVRELLDNAIDSGADRINLTLSAGGNELVSVSDNGTGMDRDDLSICWKPHATSKISSVEDLEKIKTLGFRGEALSSLAACSKLEIISTRNGNTNRIIIDGTKKPEVHPYSGSSGTTVNVRNLFYNLPARRRFLKSPRSEYSLCRKIFTEKAAAHPDITFRLFSDGVLKMFLSSADYKKRITDIWASAAPPDAYRLTEVKGNGFNISLIHAIPDFARKDRKYIHIYVNRRRIDEYSFVQAIQYAYDEWLPGGKFPIAFTFIEIDPALIDFNIHPAKKEARFRDPDSIRHLLIESIKDQLINETHRKSAQQTMYRQNDFSPEIYGKTNKQYSNFPSSGSSISVSEKNKKEFASYISESARKEEIKKTENPDKSAPGFRYLGQIMGVFLLAETEDGLYIIDQHAAHERILFEKFKNAAGSTTSEKLLIPRKLTTDSRIDMKLELRKEKFEKMGIKIEKVKNGKWELTELPSSAGNMENIIAGFLESGSGETGSLEKDLWADMACKSAVKDNQILDEAGAAELIKEAFNLETPRCPHGRPIWFKITKDELYGLVGRKI